MSRWLSVWAVLLAVPAAWAQEDGDLLDASLEDLLSTPVEVWSASKSAETEQTAPSVVEVVTFRDLSLWGFRTVAEVLRFMTGFYVVDDHAFPNVAVRGIPGSQGGASSTIKVMIDGKPVPFRTTSENWLGFELIPIEAVSRIEVLRGPASALFGADAFLATINVVLKDPAQWNGGHLRVGVGSEATALSDVHGWNDLDRDAQVAAGVQKGDVGLLFAAGLSAARRDGLAIPSSSPRVHLPEYADPDAPPAAQHDDHVLLGRLLWNGDRGTVSATVYGSAVRRGAPFSGWLVYPEGIDSLGRDAYTRLSLSQFVSGLDGELTASDALTLRLQGTYFQGRANPDDRVEVGSAYYYVHRKFSYRGTNVVAEGDWRFARDWSAIAGFELVYDHEDLAEHERIDKTTHAVVGTIAASKDTANFVNPAGYLQVRGEALDGRLKLTGGVRYDYHNLYGNHVSARGAVVAVWNDRFSTKLLYGNAFKAPSPYQLYAEPLAAGDVVGNENLAYQTVHTVEFAPYLQVSKYLQVRATAAYSRLSDKAEFLPAGVNTSAQNVATMDVLSLELGWKLAVGDGFAAFSNFDVQRVWRDTGERGYRADLVGDSQLIAPVWQLRFGVSAAVPKISLPLRLVARGQVVGQRNASAENAVEAGEVYALPPYFVGDLLVTLDKIPLFPQGETQLSFGAYNVLDAEGPDAGFSGVDYPLQPRRFLLELTQRF